MVVQQHKALSSPLKSHNKDRLIVSTQCHHRSTGKERPQSEARSIKDQARLIQKCRKIIYAKFKSSPSLRKRLGFQSNVPNSKRKTLTTF